MKFGRAYSVFEVKSVDDDERIIEGIATTPTPDRTEDVVEPEGAQFQLPIALLWQHDSHQPIGHVEWAKVTKAGIHIRARIARGVLPRIDEAWALIKAGLVRGLSIGFRPLEIADIKGSYGMRFLKWEWLELSAVTIPANAEASIQSIKSFDTFVRDAASGAGRVDSLPGAPGIRSNAGRSGAQINLHAKGNKVKTIQEQIAALEAARAAKAARMQELLQKSIEEGRSTDEAEQEEFDGLEAEVKAADDDLRRLRVVERMVVATARQVPSDNAGKSAAGAARGPTIHIPKADPDEKFAGQMFTRRVIAKALAYLSQGELSVAQIAEMRWGKTHPQLVQVIKASVAGGSSSTGTGDWGGELVSIDERYTGDFIEYLNSRTIYNQLPLRAIPANVLVKGQDGQATGYWVGESKAIPATKLDFFDVTLTPLKVAALAVISNELIRDSSPSAEMLVRDGLVEAASQRIDATFLSTSGAVTGVSPAGLLNGVVAGTPSGTDADSLRADIATLYAGFISAKNASGLHFVTTTSLAKQISLMRNALGQREFADLGASGGTLEGDPVVVGDNVGSGHLILLKPSDIYKIGDGGLQVSMSREATIEQADDPTGASDTPAAQSKTPVNMFQSESTAIKVVRSMNFAKRRSSAVAYMSGADYGGST